MEAPWLEYIPAGSNVDDYESLQYFQRQLGESGIRDALVQKGVEENDTILIGEYQFDYIFKRIKQHERPPLPKRSTRGELS